MRLNRLQNLAALLAIIFLGFACDYDPDEIGIGIQPDSDKLNVYDTTLPVTAYSVFVDSVRTDETSRTMIGSYYDPVFGTSTSSLAIQLKLSSSSVSLGDSPVLDSMVMVLDYTTLSLSNNETLAAYGDTNTPQTFRIFEIDETLIADTTSYYSNYEVALKAGEIASLTFEPRPTDSIMIDTTKFEAQLKMKMNDSFVQKFRDADSTDFASLDGFLNFFKGIYIQPDEVTNGGAIMFFNLGSVFSGMTLYYRNAEEDSLEYVFPITSTSARFMHFMHNYDVADPQFLSQLNGDTALGQDKFYVQSMAGVAAIIEIPDLRGLNNLGEIALNEAKLFIENNDMNSVFLPPEELAMLHYDYDGTKSVIYDQLEGTEYFGGVYDYDKGRTEFRLTQQLQIILSTDTIPPRFYLGVSGASILPNRMVCNGFNQNPGGLKLKIIYSQLSDQ